MRRWSLPAWVVVVVLFAVACGEPPNKEMDQAQGAIDAAKAAGAEQYASAEYTAAVEALQRAREAVVQGDYRLALDRALDSRERAQNAAREAAEKRAHIRGEVERTMAEVATLTAQANVRLEAARKSRVSPRLLREPVSVVTAVNTDVQKAGELMKAGDYLAAQPLLQDIKARIQKAIAALDAAMPTQQQRRRR